MKKYKELIAAAAPTISMAMDGPFAGTAVRFLAKQLDREDLSDGKRLQTFLPDFMTDMANIQRLKEIDSEFNLMMEKMDIDLSGLNEGAGGIAKPHNRHQLYLSLAFIFAYFVVLVGVMMAELLPGTNPGATWIVDSDGIGSWVNQTESLMDLIHVLLGVLTAGVGQVLSYWFGGRVFPHQPEQSHT